MWSVIHIRDEPWMSNTHTVEERQMGGGGLDIGVWHSESLKEP